MTDESRPNLEALDGGRTDKPLRPSSGGGYEVIGSRRSHEAAGVDSRVWHIEGHAYSDEPEPLAVPDADGDHVLSNPGVRVNDVGPFVPVRAEVYRHADKEAVLRVLDKICAHVEEYWEAR